MEFQYNKEPDDEVNVVCNGDCLDTKFLKDLKEEGSWPLRIEIHEYEWNINFSIDKENEPELLVYA